MILRGARRSCIFIICLFGCFQNTFAEDALEAPRFSPVEAPRSTWVFSGIVTNENGEDYGYFFQLQRDNNHFHASVALLNASDKKVIFRDESDADLPENAPYNWHVGNSFLRFNPINDSWIFGVKNKSKQGFNFKVDMLKQFEAKPSSHHLRPGVTMMISQTSELNGHITLNNEDSGQFVTAKEAWFRQIWQDPTDATQHPLTSVLCRFNDGSSFYSINLPELDAQSAAVAGWYNAQGERKPVSQFVQVLQSEAGEVQIHASPQLNMKLASTNAQNKIAAGFIESEIQPGFCMVSTG